jgi:hypothetical protein
MFGVSTRTLLVMLLVVAVFHYAYNKTPSLRTALGGA